VFVKWGISNIGCTQLFGGSRAYKAGHISIETCVITVAQGHIRVDVIGMLCAFICEYVCS